LLPDHAPEVVGRALHWSLCRNVLALAVEALPTAQTPLVTHFISEHFWHCPLTMRSRIDAPVTYPSVSIDLYVWAHSSKSTAAGLLLWAQPAAGLQLQAWLTGDIN